MNSSFPLFDIFREHINLDRGVSPREYGERYASKNKNKRHRVVNNRKNRRK